MNFDHFKYIEYGFQQGEDAARFTLDEQGNEVWAWKDIFINKSRISKLVQYGNDNHISFHRTLQRYCRPERSDYHISTMLIDFDSEDDPSIAVAEACVCIEKLMHDYDLDESVFEIYYSASKGVGAIIRPETFLKGIIPNPEPLYKELLAPYGDIFKTLDMGIFGTARLWREINAVHTKTMRYRIPLTLDELRNWDIEQIIALSCCPRTIAKKKPQFATSIWKELQRLAMERTAKKIESVRIEERMKVINAAKPPEQQQIEDELYNDPSEVLAHLPYKWQHLENGALDGDRNDGLCCIMWLMNKKGYDRRMKIDTALEFNRRCPKPKDESIIKSQLKHLIK